VASAKIRALRMRTASLAVLSAAELNTVPHGYKRNRDESDLAKSLSAHHRSAVHVEDLSLNVPGKV
jgi:hypothetical protein